jgi:hypothetical protein
MRPSAGKKIFYLVLSDERSFCRSKVIHKMITSDHGGFAEVQPSAKLPAPANSFSQELNSRRGALL